MKSESKSLKALMQKSDRRRAIQMNSTELVKTTSLQPNHPPLVVQPALEGVNLAEWAATHQDWLNTQLYKHGGLLFRNFRVHELPQFEQLIRTVSGELLEYTYRSTPRTHVSGNLYTSTEYPANQSIPLHNEMAYTRDCPLKIWFFCVQAAQQGGTTPIADSRRVFERIDPQIRERFQHKQIMYVRNYGENVDLTWQTVFQTNDRTVVEQFCHQAGITYEWRSNDCLRTSQVCQAVATHPTTGEQVWFNQAHLFHISSLPPIVRDSLLTTFGEENLPRHAYYGDGSAIEADALDHIRQIYQQETVDFPWHNGDILLLDNLLAAHGRTPFTGSRRVIVGMSEPFRIASEEIEPEMRQEVQ
jgi:alpha-ketoglutarate-dependent taurine dioxygenase